LYSCEDTTSRHHAPCKCLRLGTASLPATRLPHVCTLRPRYFLVSRPSYSRILLFSLLQLHASWRRSQHRWPLTPPRSGCPPSAARLRCPRTLTLLILSLIPSLRLALLALLSLLQRRATHHHAVVRCVRLEKLRLCRLTTRFVGASQNVKVLFHLLCAKE